MLVLDTSAAAPFILVDEAQHRLPAVVAAIGDGACTAPALWKWEIANLLWKGLRLRRVLESELPTILNGIEEFGIKFDHESIDQALSRTLSLASRYGLTAYDASYLELALRLDAELASYDADLRAAAIAEGVLVHPAP